MYFGKKNYIDSVATFLGGKMKQRIQYIIGKTWQNLEEFRKTSPDFLSWPFSFHFYSTEI